MSIAASVCGFHYESGGKCNVTASPTSAVWPQIGLVCAEHELLLLRERDQVPMHLGEIMEDIITPTREKPETGDWVIVFGQVAEKAVAGNVIVTLFSSSDEYRVAVREDRVKKIQPPPALAERCHHLREDAQQRYVRCTKHLGHGGDHASQGYGWDSKHTTAYLEER